MQFGAGKSDHCWLEWTGLPDPPSCSESCPAHAKRRIGRSVKKRIHNVGNVLRCDAKLAGFVLHDVDHDLDSFVAPIVFVAHKVWHLGKSGPTTSISTMPDSLPPTGSLVSRARSREIFSQIPPRSYLDNHSIFGACRVHDKNCVDRICLRRITAKVETPAAVADKSCRVAHFGIGLSIKQPRLRCPGCRSRDLP